MPLKIVHSPKNRSRWLDTRQGASKAPQCRSVNLGLVPGHAKVLRCWVHRARNVMPLVPRRYQPAFQAMWNAVAYADSLDAARVAFDKLKTTWSKDAADAVARMERDIDALLAHYEFPRDHWEAAASRPARVRLGSRGDCPGRGVGPRSRLAPAGGAIVAASTSPPKR